MGAQEPGTLGNGSSTMELSIAHCADSGSSISGVYRCSPSVPILPALLGFDNLYGEGSRLEIYLNCAVVQS